MGAHAETDLQACSAIRGRRSRTIRVRPVCIDVRSLTVQTARRLVPITERREVKMAISGGNSPRGQQPVCLHKG